MGLGGVADLETRQQAELHGLTDQRIGAGNDGLAGDHRGGGRQNDQRQEQRRRGPDGRTVFSIGVGMGEHQRALSEIVQQQRWQHQTEPRRLNRLAAEVAEIGIQRLAARDRQKDQRP